MDKLAQLQVFVRVAERGNFSSVARDLQITQSAVSKAISSLEQDLGAQLVSRNTRKVVLTDTGQAYYDRCRQILNDIDAADAAAGSLSAGISGALKITAPIPFGLAFISPRVARFQAIYPGLKIHLELNDQNLNLVEEKIDVAIRLGHLTSPGLVVRKLGDSPIEVVAAPTYLAAHGVPTSPTDLTTHNCLAYTNHANPNTWAFTHNGISQTISVTGNYRSNSLLALKDTVIAAVGIACLPLWMVDTDIQAGLLKPILKDHHLSSFAIHAVFPSSRLIPAKVKLFVDFIQNELGTVAYFT